MFYFLKARSALPDAAITTPIIGYISRFAAANRDFSLPDIIYTPSTLAGEGGDEGQVYIVSSNHSSHITILTGAYYEFN
jgi:hypothetical protein